MDLKGNHLESSLISFLQHTSNSYQQHESLQLADLLWVSYNVWGWIADTRKDFQYTIQWMHSLFSLQLHFDELEHCWKRCFWLNWLCQAGIRNVFAEVSRKLYYSKKVYTTVSALFFVTIIFESNTTSIEQKINKSKTSVVVVTNHVRLRSVADCTWPNFLIWT